MRKSGLGLLFVLVSDLFPLYGLFKLGWSPLSAALVFVIETLMLLAIFEIEMLASARATRDGRFREKGADILGMAFIFVPVHLIFASLFFGGLENGPAFSSIGRTVASALSISLIGIALMGIRYLAQAVSLLSEKGRALASLDDAKKGVSALVGRLMFMQITVVFGGMASMVTGRPALGIMILIILKTLHDLEPWSKRRKKISR